MTTARPVLFAQRWHFWVLALGLFAQCRSLNPRTGFDATSVPPAPDFARLENWAAHPDKSDPADRTPNPTLKNEQANAEVDVFFLHPTTLTGDRKSGQNRRAWNGDIRDAKLNRKTDDSPIQYQASIFNGTGRVFAPRYRQAHFHSFFTRDTASAAQALEIAYADVRAAFEFYLKNWNNGRPIVIAAHSQGARHAMRLLREYFEGKPLGEKLVVAYIAGWPVPKGFFSKIPPCENPDQTGCFCSWRTWERRFGQRKAFETNVICTNPLSWTIEEGKYVPRTENQGAVLLKFGKVLPQICDAEVCKGVLLCSKPKFPGSVFIRTKNYHAGDLNLYYLDVRANAEGRVRRFLKK